MIKILKIFFLKNEKIFKKFFKMKYNRSSSFIYKKEFCRLYRHRATAHSTKGAPRKAQSLLALEKISAYRSQEGKGTSKKKGNLKKKKIKLQHFKKWKNLYKIVLKNEENL